MGTSAKKKSWYNGEAFDLARRQRKRQQEAAQRERLERQALEVKRGPLTGGLARRKKASDQE